MAPVNSAAIASVSGRIGKLAVPPLWPAWLPGALSPDYPGKTPKGLRILGSLRQTGHLAGLPATWRQGGTYFSRNALGMLAGSVVMRGFPNSYAGRTLLVSAKGVYHS
jgi:hypothetical protein